MAPRLFGTSGIRRLASELSDDFIRSLAFSLAAQPGLGSVAVGRDTRPSSPMLAERFISYLSEAGVDAIDLGIATTPTVAMASEEYGVGVVITASHNPPEYNGFKFWSHGRAYSPVEEKAIEDSFSLGCFSPAEKKGRVTVKDYSQPHIDRILSGVGKADKKVRVLLDCANGAGVFITPRLLELMGCEVIAINTGTDGRFAHGLEPTAENLKGTCGQVKELNCDIGVVHDGDADRSAVIGRDGLLVDWDSFLSVLAYGHEKVVTTVDASMRIEDVCGEVIRTPIGDVAVANAVCESGADFGGEPSGSMIFPDVHLFPDGPLAAAKAVKLVSQDRFYEVIASLRRYPVTRVKLFYRDANPSDFMPSLKEALRAEFSEADDINELDGIRLAVGSGWVLVRPSGTEPCVRITAEAHGKEELDALVGRCESCVRSILDVA